MKTIEDIKLKIAVDLKKKKERYESKEWFIYYEDLRNLIIERCRELEKKHYDWGMIDECNLPNCTICPVKRELMRLGSIKESELR